MLCAALLALTLPLQDGTAGPDLGVHALVQLTQVTPRTRFAPDGFDCEQWAQVAVAAGLQGLVLPWYEGASEVLDDLAAACAAHGLKLGLSLDDGQAAPRELPAGVPVVAGSAAQGAPFELEAAVHAAQARGDLALVALKVDPSGRIPADEARRLRTFREWRARTFDLDLARGAQASASNERGGSGDFAAAGVTDGDPDTFWFTDDEVRRAFLDLELPAAQVVDRVVLEEPAGLHGRIRRFQLQGRRDNLWSKLVEGRSVGARLVLHVEPALYQAFRLIVQEADQSPALSRFSLFAAPPRVEIHADERVFLGSTRVRFSTSNPAAIVRYTLDGSRPSAASTPYTQPLTIDESCTLTALAFAGEDVGVLPARLDLRAYTAGTLRAPETEAPLQVGIGARWTRADLWTLDQLDPAEGRVAGGGDLGIWPKPGGKRPFVTIHQGFVKAPRDGIYAFFVKSSDGARLYIGDERVVDNDGVHGVVEAMGEIGLKAGWHALRVDFFHATGEPVLQVAWRGPRLSKQVLGPNDLGRR